MVENVNSYDLIVVGGGLAGLVAGVRAVELGLRSLILEKGDGEAYPCNSRQSGGIVHIGFHDPYRPEHELTDLIMRMTDGDARPELATALAGNGARLLAWLQEHGTRFMRFNPQEGYRWCMAPPRALRAGIDWENRGPDMVLRHLAREFVRLGGTLRLRSRATSLVMHEGACVGVSGESDGVQMTWRGANVLIADGGFQSNRELFHDHIGQNFDAVFQRGARTGMGDGLRMAVAAGAALTQTDRFYGHLLCGDARTNDQVWPYPELDAIATAGVVIDGSGTRVVDEGRSGVYLTNALAALPGERNFFTVFDSEIWENQGTSARIPANPLLEKAGGKVYRANTLEELAELIAVPAAALADTLERYHAALGDGRLASLDVPRSETMKPQPIRTAPFMAIAVIPGITYTMGGIAIDGHAQVLDGDGRTIPGLFAAGATTGGLEGGRNAVYIGGLIKAGSFGLLAAERAAERLGKRVAPVEARKAPSSASQGSTPVDVKAITTGLARFPILRATLRYGRIAAMAIGFVVGATVLSIGWPSLGLLGLLPAVFLAGVAVIAVLSYTELVRLITELLIPE